MDTRRDLEDEQHEEVEVGHARELLKKIARQKRQLGVLVRHNEVVLWGMMVTCGNMDHVIDATDVLCADVLAPGDVALGGVHKHQPRVLDLHCCVQGACQCRGTHAA